MLAFFLCTVTSWITGEERIKRRKHWGRSVLEVCSFKKGFEERSDILTCIWQDQVWLQFMAALSYALGKTRANHQQVKSSKRTTNQDSNSPYYIRILLCLLTVWVSSLPDSINQLEDPHSKDAAAPGYVHHLHSTSPGHTPEEQAAPRTEKCAGRRVGSSSIAIQLPTPNRTSLSPNPGWNLAPLPRCVQYRWQDRRACWCRKAVPVLRRWQGGKAGEGKGHQDQCSFPWSQPLFQRLLKRFGKRRGLTTGCHCPSI